MHSFSKRLSILGLISSCYAYAPLRAIQARGVLSSDATSLDAPTADFIEGCSMWFTTYEGDTCETIISSSDITLEELIEWNPSLEDGICDDLIRPDTDYCVGIEQPREPPTETTPLPSKPTPPPTQNGISTPAPVQPGMTKSCSEFHFVEMGQGCLDIIPQYPSLTLELLYQWNPAIGKRCTMMWAETYICVGVIEGTPTEPPRETTTTTKATKGTPSPIGPGTTKDCRKWAFARTGDTCETILSRSRDVESTVADLFRWNPWIETDCSGLVEQTYLCIVGPAAPTPSTTTTTTTTTKGTPSPIASGTTKNCQKWAYVRTGDSCQTILSRNKNTKSTVADLFRWNRSIKPGCTDLVEGNYICIVGPDVIRPPPTTTRTTTITTTTTMRTTTKRRTTTVAPMDPDGTPSPVQPGQVEGCKKWAYVKDGQTCNDIIARFPGLTLVQLYTWNPAIGASCSTMWARTYVCVRV
ncbi:hypothetical protein TWF281_002459 [Arthrobotrys megalospora]